jgi:PAS domain S-box-containing protein
MTGKPSYAELEQQLDDFKKRISLSEQEEVQFREKEARERLLLATLPIAFYIAYPFGDYGGTWVSEQIEAISGFPPHRFIEDPGLWAVRLHPDDRQRVLSSFDDLAEKETITNEYRWQVADDSYRWVLDSATIIRNAEGKPIHSVGTWLDITESKQAQEEAEKSGLKFRELADMLPQIVFETDLQGNLTFINNQAYTMTGYSQEDYREGVNALSLLAEEDRQRAAENLQHILEGHVSRHGNEYTMARKDGSRFPILAHSMPIHSEGVAVGFRGIIVDISSLKEAEAALQESRQNYKDLSQEFRALLDAIPDSLTLQDSEFKIVWANQWVADRLGKSAEELIGLYCYEIIHSKSKPCKDCPALGSMQSCEPGEAQVKDHDGTIWNIRSIPLPDDEGKAASFIELGREITQHRKTEEALRESEERYRDIFESASDIIHVVDPEGRLLYSNPSWSKILGYSSEEAMGIDVFDILDDECLDSCRNYFQEVLAEGRVENVVTVFRAKDGRKVHLEGSLNARYSSGKPESVQCIFRDVTERRKLVEEIGKAHKLESIGLLAGGIAHDFNNILTAIGGNISLARRYSEPGEKVHEKLGKAEKALLRARDLTQQLLTFSKGGEPVIQTISITDTIKDSSSFALRGSNVKCEFNLPEKLWPVKADEGQISQVMQNLIINADQAMPDGGKITITVTNVDIDNDKNLALKPGRYVAVHISDQGCGIQKKALAKIFDPYFSTKQEGHGLGLATAYSIIKNHNGMLNVKSEPGKGAEFTFYLPASFKESGRPESTDSTLHKGEGMILLMDDEEGIREVAAEMLANLGYEVHAASDGQEALEMYIRAESEGKPYVAVIMDLTVPGGLGGKETINKLHEIDPSVKAIVSSGYANNSIMANYETYGFVGVVPKPYKIQDLGAVLNEVLER